MRDDALLQQYAATHDPDAFAQLVERYSDLVYATCLRTTRDAHDAQDAAQECFLSLARKAGSIHSSLAGWLHTTARHASLAMVKESRKRGERETDMAPTRRNDGQPSWWDLEPHIDAALQGLPQALRSPVVLHYLQGKPQSEIAELMGVDRSTVSRRLKRGVAELRQCLEKAGVGLSVAALVSCLGQSSLEAAPIALKTALGKMAIAGVGKTAGVTAPMSAGSATSTSAAFGTLHGKFASGAAVAVLAAAGFVVHRELNRPRAPQAVKAQSEHGRARNSSGGSQPGPQTELSPESGPRPVSAPQTAETTEVIIVTGLKLHVVDPEEQAEDFRYTYAYSKVLGFTPLRITEQVEVLFGMVVFAEQGHAVLVEDDRIDVHLDGDGQVDFQATWPVEPGTTFRQVKRFESAYRGATVSVPILLDLVRGRGGKPLGEFHTNATLTGQVKLDAGPAVSFAIGHLDPQLTLSAAGANRPRLIIDTNGDGELDWRHDSAEHFDMGEPFRIRGKAYSLTACDGRAGAARFRRLP